MMHWALFLTVLCVTCARAQAVACIDDSQCTSGYYCVTDLLACRPCLRCEDLNREPPKSHVSCIRSVVECGPCLKGLVDDRAGELGASCTEPSSPDEGMPVYVWAVIACLILLFVLIALGAVIFMLRRTDTFKILACTSVQTPVLNGNPPSAPAPPPPYNYSADYAPVRPSSPLQQPAPYTEDASSPLVKRAPSSPGAGGDTRQSAGSQAALVYHNPAYVRNAQPPPSYDSAYSESEADAPFVPQDEDTMPSPWTPGTAVNNNDNSGNESGVPASSVTGTEQAGAVALRRPSRSDALAVPAKIVCVREDSNNNRGESSTAARDEPPPAPPAPAASVVINVLNVNSVHQLNDVTL